MYAALRDDKSRTGEIHRFVKNNKQGRVHEDEHRPNGSKQGYSKLQSKNVSMMGSDCGSSICSDEWELLDEELGDAHHYFSTHSSGPGIRSRQWSLLKDIDRSKSAINRAVDHDNDGRSWRSLPNYSRKVVDEYPREARRQPFLSKGKFELEEGEEGREEEEGAGGKKEQDDEPFTTLDSIIAAAKRLDSNRVPSKTIEQNSLAVSTVLQPTPLPDRMNSLNGNGTETNEQMSSERLSKQSFHSSNEATTPEGRIIGTKEQEGLLSSVPRQENNHRNYGSRSWMTRGFTWNSTESMQFITLKTLKQLPPAQQSLLGSLDSESHE